MASIKVIHQNAELVQGMISGILNVCADINFIPLVTFEKAMEKGLDPEKWESSSRAFSSKILIEGIYYKEYLSSMNK